MSETPLLGLPLIEAAQAQKHVTHNEALLRLDAAVHLAVITRGAATPPAAPLEGDRYLIATGATGAWTSHEGELAFFEAAIWRFAVPREGWRLWVADEDKLLVFDGAIWRDLQAISTLQNMALLGVNTTADTNNRLSVSSPGVLLTHAGTDQRLKINKQAAADTASLLYQTNFSGRAELGLAGDDDFHFKVSANGSVWNEAIVIDKDTGAVTMPNTAPGGLADGDKGDITVSGGATVWTIDADAVGDAKIRNSIANSVIGRAANTTGDPADIAATADGQVLRLSGTTLGFGTVGTAGLGAAVVGNGKLATMVNGTIKARVTAGTGTPDDATGTQITALLDPFTSALKGLAPASGGGTGNFLRADGAWAAPSPCLER